MAPAIPQLNQPRTSGALGQRALPGSDSVVATGKDGVRLGKLVTADELVSKIHQLHDDSNFYKMKFYKNAWLNRAFNDGQQWVYFPKDSLDIREEAVPNDKIRHTANKVGIICENVRAVMKSSQPTVEVVPATAEIADQQVSAASQMVMEYIKEIIHWRDLADERDLCRLMDGTVCLRGSVNPTPVGMQNVPQVDPATGQVTAQQVPEFELAADVYSIFDVHVFPVDAPSFRTIRGVMFAKWMPVEDARMMWPDKANEIHEDAGTGLNEQYRNRTERLHSPASQIASGPGHAKRGQCRVFEYMELPSPQWPEGLKCTVVGRVLVNQSVNPYIKLFPTSAPNFLKLGCVFYRAHKIAGRCWGRGYPEDLRPLQVRHNRMITDMERNRVACGRNKFLVQKAAGVTDEQLTNEHGTIIYYNGGLSNAPVSVVPAVKIDYGPEIMQNDRDMDDVGGRPQIARGINQAQVRSGEQVSLLQEAANIHFGIIADDTENGDANFWRLMLTLAKAFYTDEKIIRICGKTKRFAPLVIQAADLYTDVRVVNGSALPKNRAAWNRMIAELWQLGAIVDDQGRPDVSWLKQNLDQGGYKFEDRHAADRENAQSEDVAMLSGQPVPVQPYDNDAIHLEQHELCLKKNPDLPPPVVQARLFHMQMHMQRLAQQMMPPPGMAMPPEGGMGETPENEVLVAQREQQQEQEKQKQQQQPKGQ
jgi:hypothetical protein